MWRAERLLDDIHYGTTKTSIPKKIFTYWDGEPRPKLVDACILRMKMLHPGWTVTVLTRDKIRDELPCLKFLSKQHQSDWARVSTLHSHGGVWLDSTCLCQRPVTDWVDMNHSALQGFSTPFDDNVFENWAFAVPAKSRFLEFWKEEVRKACIQGHEAYCSSIPNIFLGNLRSHLPYLSMHAGFCVVKNAHPDLPVVMRRSIDKNMPFHYIDSKKWNLDDACQSLISARDYKKHEKTALIKLRGLEREHINNLSSTIQAGSIIGHLYDDLRYIKL